MWFSYLEGYCIEHSVGAAVVTPLILNVRAVVAPHDMNSARSRPLTPSLQDIAAFPCRWFASAVNYTFVRPCMNTRPLGQPILAEELLGYHDVKVSIPNTFPLHFRGRPVELD